MTMQIIVRHQNNGATSEEDITEAALLFLGEIRWRSRLGVDDADVDVMLPALRAIDHEDATRIADRLVEERKAEEERQRQRDAFARQREQQEADRRKAAHQLAKEMREAEPALAAAGWTDAQLVQLRYMRNSGLA